MTPRRRRHLLVLPLVLALAGCPGFGDEDPPGVFSQVPEFPTYDQHVKQILDANCIECHSETPMNGAPAGIRLDTYDNPANGTGARLLAPRIQVRVVNSTANRMPPASRPAVAEIDRQILAKWIANGAPRNAQDANNVNNTNNNTNNNAGVPTFAQILPIFERNGCVGCHGPGLQEAGYRVDTLENTLAIGDVVPCDADGSILVQKLRNATLPFGSLMPLGGNEIPEDDYQLIRTWINMGADTEQCDANNANNTPNNNPNNNNDMDAGPDVVEDTADDVAVEPMGMRRDFSGSYFVGVKTPLGEAPLLLQVEVEVAPGLDTIDFTFQVLSADRAAAPRMPVGSPRTVAAVSFAADGTWVVDLGEVTLPADANPAAAELLRGTLMLHGFTCGGELMCGDVTGALTTPAPRDLAGSTFGGIVSANIAGATPVSSCLPGWCGLPEDVNNANNEPDVGIDAQMDVEPDAPLTHPIEHPSFTDVQTVLQSNRCLGCHGLSDNSGGLRLNTRDAILTGGLHGPAVVACSPDTSNLITKLRPATPPFGAAMPFGSGMIPTDEVQTLRNWIADGALLNYTPGQCN